METYSSTTINMFDKFCPKALKFYEDETPYDRSQFEYGVASHAIIEACGKWKTSKKTPYLAPAIESYKILADKVCGELIEKGRTFRGHHEPPMSPTNVFTGRDVSLDYLASHELPYCAEYEIQYEEKLTDEINIIALHDCVFEEHIDGKHIIVSRDWKGWQGSPSELDTVQRKAQAITLYFAKGMHADEMRLEIVNLQTHRLYATTIPMDEQGFELIMQWRDDLAITCNAMTKTREARPGVGCLSCYWNYCCEDRLFSDLGKDRLAHKLVNLEIERKKTIDILKARQELPIEIEGGYVGWKKFKKRIPSVTAREIVYHKWFDQEWDDVKFIDPVYLRAFLINMGLSVSNIQRIADNLYDPDDVEKGDFLESTLVENNYRKFGVWED